MWFNHDPRSLTIPVAHQGEAANIVFSDVIYTSHCRLVVGLFFKVACVIALELSKARCIRRDMHTPR